MAKVMLKGEPSKAWYRKRKDDLVRKVRWQRRQIDGYRKLFSAYQKAFAAVARLDPKVAALCLAHLDAVIVRGPGDPGGCSDAFLFNEPTSLGRDDDTQGDDETSDESVS